MQFAHECTRKFEPTFGTFYEPSSILISLKKESVERMLEMKMFSFHKPIKFQLQSLFFYYIAWKPIIFQKPANELNVWLCASNLFMTFSN